MENLKGCLDCKHSKKDVWFLVCTHPSVARRYTTFDSNKGKSGVNIAVVAAHFERDDDFGKCKREAIYFEPTRYYKFKQWIKQLLK